MNVFKDYVKYRLRSSLLRTVAFAVIALIFTYDGVDNSLKIWNIPIDYVGDNMPYVPEYNGYINFDILSMCLYVLIVVIAVLETICFKNKRNLDTIYSMPLSRFRLALAHYVSGALQIFAIHTVCVLFTFVLAIPYAGKVNLWLVPAYYIFSLIFGIGFYSFVCFFFGEGNTVYDGIAFVLIWSCVCFFALETLASSDSFASYLPISVYRHIQYDCVTSYWIAPSAPLDNLGTIFTGMSGASSYYREYAENVMRASYMFYIWGIIYAACAYGYFYSFVRRGAQMAGEISDSAFGYKFLIPFFAITTTLMGRGGNDILLSILFPVLIIIAMVLGYILYRRSVKLKKTDLMTILVVALIIFSVSLFYFVAVIIPLLAALVLTIVCLVCLINAVSEREDKREIVKRVLIFGLVLVTLVLLIIGMCLTSLELG